MPVSKLRNLAIALVTGSSILLGSTVQAQQTPPERLPIEELRTFVEVLERIKQAYVEPIDDKTLLENAIKGMLGNLDPHSDYLSEKDFNELHESTSGEFGGLGLEIGTDGENLKIISPIDDTPAYKAGLQAGDLIVRIDGQSTQGMSLSDAVRKMRGQPGTSISLSIVRATEQPFEVTIERATINARSVRSQDLQDGYMLLRISQFQANTAADAAQELKKFSSKQQINGLVLDLRNNPGGLLQAAVDVSDLFLQQGLIVYTKGNMAESRMDFSAGPRSMLPATVPIVVLINGGSASAAEIVAGALQDHRRAVLMGTESFGKGSVQTIVPLANNDALKLTTALYYTPSGRSIQAKGIKPDIRLEQATVTQQHRSNLKEADLDRHLQGQDTTADKPDSKTSQLIEQDFQLSQALSLLKGINISRQH